MEKTATLNLRVNLALKEQAENILQRLGIPMSTAVDMFLNQITLVGGIPFSVTLPKAPASVNADLMTGDELRAKLRRGLEDAEAGRVQNAATALNQLVMPPTHRGQAADAYVRDLRDNDRV